MWHKIDFTSRNNPSFFCKPIFIEPCKHCTLTEKIENEKKKKNSNGCHLHQKLNFQIIIKTYLSKSKLLRQRCHASSSLILYFWIFSFSLNLYTFVISIEIFASVSKNILFIGEKRKWLFFMLDTFHEFYYFWFWEKNDYYYLHILIFYAYPFKEWGYVYETS